MATAGAEYEKEMRSPLALSKSKRSVLDVFLRVVLLVASVVAVVVMVTSKQNKVFTVQVPGIPVPISVVKAAKFNYSPAFVYLVVALSVACLYSFITGLGSFMVARKPFVSTKWLLILIINDALMLGIVASAMGAVASVAYVGLKGNSHINWGKVCNIYGKFCTHAGSSIAVSLIVTVLLLLLIFINSCTLYRAAEPRN